MRNSRSPIIWIVLALFAGMLVFVLPAFIRVYGIQGPIAASAQS